jgi:hypothetical protein
MYGMFIRFTEENLMKKPCIELKVWNELSGNHHRMGLATSRSH